MDLISRHLDYSTFSLSLHMSRHGFSLVELLVTLGIISVLVALLIPAVSNTRSAALSATCQSNLRQIGICLTQYASDNEGMYPPSADDATGGYYPWYWILMGKGRTAGINYMGSAKVLACPSGNMGPIYPSNPSLGVVSYSMTDLPLWQPASSRTDQLPKFFSFGLTAKSIWPLVMDGDAARIFSLDNPIASTDVKSRWNARHAGWANVLMVDGHIERVQYGDKRWSQSALNGHGYY